MVIRLMCSNRLNMLGSYAFKIRDIREVDQSSELFPSEILPLLKDLAFGNYVIPHQILFRQATNHFQTEHNQCNHSE